MGALPDIGFGEDRWPSGFVITEVDTETGEESTWIGGNDSTPTSPINYTTTSTGGSVEDLEMARLENTVRDLVEFLGEKDRPTHSDLKRVCREGEKHIY